MKLTPLQHKFLKVYMGYHTAGLTFRQLLRNRWPRLLLFVAVGLCFYLFAVPTHPAIGWLSVGICTGVLYGDIRGYKSSRHIWPIFDNIIDWKQVSDLMNSHEHDVA